ncbi:STAS domain-containing protein [Solimonas terrae]|uniref:STAS domain-containing protein n=1 Tax=Solimonas terrae TaxID=1396819 RepID=A0A6M2BW71_9GAMM|nr:STAS domain-containing protein [Solimonas terrae]NGY06892.1 STAS domain-containing protein [Solimonas terrae]
MSIADAEAAPLVLAADLGIERVAALRAQLLDVLEQPAVTLAADAVVRVHGATLQLLTAFCRERRAAGRETHWANASGVLRDAAQRLGLGPQLHIEEN